MVLTFCNFKSIILIKKEVTMMKISAKARYALASMIKVASNDDQSEYISVVSISEDLGISKIYLEQIFSLLKRSGLVQSSKGPQGGYHLLQSPEKITAFDILQAIEQSLFEPAETTISESAVYMEKSISYVLSKLDDTIKEVLKGVTLHDLVLEAEKNKQGTEYMYYL